MEGLIFGILQYHLLYIWREIKQVPVSSHRLHMDNIKKLQKAEIEENRIGKGKDPTAIHKFGFPAVTCCGYIGQNNEWCDDWVVSDDILMDKLQPRK